MATKKQINQSNELLMEGPTPQQRADLEERADFYTGFMGLVDWVEINNVSPKDAVLLLRGLNPHNSHQSQYSGDSPMLALRLNDYAHSHPGARALADWWRLALEWKKAGQLHEVSLSRDFGEALLYLDSKYRTAESARLDAASATPVSPRTAPDWMQKAQDRAHEIIAGHRSRDLFPPQQTIANQIAEEFRAAGVVGAGGKPLTGSYIKRHALAGISSEVGKRLTRPELS